MISEETMAMIERFNRERHWDRFHTPAGFAKSIAIEAGELLECFQWDEEHYDGQAVKEELADVLAYCVLMADQLGLDMDRIIREKFAKNALRYPVDHEKR